ncbi:SDR family oxidoreductase [Rossellomorea aquimaris]|uniref:SDR family oxidoreductase n=1 Tax=Rossellomorea aquimaris TaxID=189382 RepID=UPI001CFED032|nr:NAD-dependent epimerase/dehydratase family protein [Rossellomorea aquimaris]
MRILILGGTGFLGSTLLGKAEALANTVLGTSRKANEKLPNMVKLDVTDKETLERTIREFHPDVIVWSLLSMDEEDVLINTGLANLLNVIAKQTKLIFISTDGVFSEGNGGYEESDETKSIAEKTPLSIYINSKISGEKMVQEYHPNHIIIRTGPLYGKDLNQGIEHRTQRVMKQIAEKGCFYAATNMYRSFVHIDDLADAILELCTMDYKGILHVGPEQKESYFTFYQKRLRSLGYEENVIKQSMIDPEENPDLILDTSMNTERVRGLLKTEFRSVCSEEMKHV